MRLTKRRVSIAAAGCGAPICAVGIWVGLMWEPGSLWHVLALTAVVVIGLAGAVAAFLAGAEMLVAWYEGLPDK